MGPSKELRGPLRCYHKSGPTTKMWGTLISLTNKALPEEQRLPSTMTKTDPKRSSPKGPPRPRQLQSQKGPLTLRQLQSPRRPPITRHPQSLEPLKSLKTPQNLKLPHSLEMPKGLKLPQNFEPSQSLQVEPLS